MPLIDNDSIYLREDLDILFIALNPPEQSNVNGHYFSGNQSTFFKQLYLSGLITKDLDKKIADELVFGDNEYNYNKRNYGVIDLLPRIVETDGRRVRVVEDDVILMIERIKRLKPKNVCIIHSKVMKSFKRFANINLSYGYNGRLFNNMDILFYCNYFPNGNNIRTETKLDIYKMIKDNL